MFDDRNNPFDLEKETTDYMGFLDSFLTQANKNEIELSTEEVLNSLVHDKNSIAILRNELCYVNLVYDDKSVLVIHTTLNESILAQYFVNNKDGYLFDVDRYRFMKLDANCEEITITITNVYEDDIVISFVNTLI